MAMFPKDEKQNKDGPPSITPSPGSSPSHACPPHGMCSKKGLRVEERKIFMFILLIDRLPVGRLCTSWSSASLRGMAGGQAAMPTLPWLLAWRCRTSQGLLPPLLQGRVGPSDGGGGKEFPSYPTPAILEEHLLHS